MPGRVSHSDDHHSRADGAPLTNDDVRDGRVEDAAVAIDEGCWRNVHAQAIVDVDRCLHVGECWSGRDRDRSRGVVGGTSPGRPCIIVDDFYFAPAASLAASGRAGW